MSDFGEGIYVAGRKDHSCAWCTQGIPMPEVHYHFHGMWEGYWQNWRMHAECRKASEPDQEFTPGAYMRPLTTTLEIHTRAERAYRERLADLKRKRKPRRESA